ncbi:ligase-associated DNA damage response endonuclease PdeM [Pelagibacterium luteolum]|uniref:Putative phosphoesterase n=1 Tax=Pelagibacterium luteolum TaxID=440168 RepID=A0A1G7Y3W8_9HYPH|nr:ligase-associated DNA damage response endonuclease PdeM [Pelagibacterium luteolum]SDG91145.1 putative phosphoesterase [Pelagibacterium luteolum]
MAQIQPVSDSDAAPVIRFHGQVFLPLASGALFWPDANALLVADLHLEKLSSYARSGQFLPPYDTGMTLARLQRDLTETGATTVIALGDSFHRDEGSTTLLDKDRATLASMVETRDWFWIAGNHDPAPHGLGGVCCAEISISGCSLRHEPRRGTPGLISGHLHPAARVAINGKSSRRPCFAWDDHLLILPAYGASTGSLNVLSPAFAGLFDKTRLQVSMLGRDRVYPVSTQRLVHG